MIGLVQNLDQGSEDMGVRKRASARASIARNRLFFTVLLALSAGVSDGAIPGEAAAQDASQPTLAGTWSASAMTEAWSTKDWGDACGPKPTASGAPAGSVTVTDQGSELAFSGAGRSFSTASCWEPTPGLKRTSHSGGKRGWSSTCASPPGDPRRANVTTRFSATDDTIVFSETGVFEFNIKGTLCRASVARSRSFKLKQRAGEVPATAPSASATPATEAPTAAPTATAEPEPTSRPSEDCDPHAPPSRLEVRPAKKLLRPGESFDLDVRVLDARTCRLQVAPKIAIEESSVLASFVTIDKSKVKIADDAPEGAGFIVVSMGGKSVRMSIEVTPPDRYAELLRARGLDEKGEDARAIVAEIETGVGSPERSAEDTARGRRIMFLAIVGGVAALLGIVALALVRRGKRAAVARVTEVPPPPNVAFFESTAAAMECPRCGRVLASGTGFCPSDGTALVPSKKPAPAPASDLASEPPSAVASAVASVDTSAVAPVATKPRRQPDKICPTCGDRFAADAAFCGKDGTSLVPIN